MERIIVEQLRDRLYYATDTIVTYIDFGGTYLQFK